MPHGYLLTVKIVVPGKDFESAWQRFQDNPNIYIPKRADDKIAVEVSESHLLAIKNWGETSEPTVYQSAYANHFGWSRNEKGWFYKKEIETYSEAPKIAVIPWCRGWAPWHTATGVLDNAAWSDLRSALRVADEMFFKNTHFKEEHGLCASCLSNVAYEDIFFFDGETFCSTGCAYA